MPPGQSMSVVKRLAVGAGFLTVNVVALSAAAATCTITADNMTFGTYSVINPIEVDTSAQITFACSGNDGVRIRGVVSISTGASGSYSSRTMQNGAATLNYNIYRNNARTRIWGDGTGGSQTRRMNCNLRRRTTCSASRTMQGRIPTGQNVPAGNYSDVLIVSASF